MRWGEMERVGQSFAWKVYLHLLTLAGLSGITKVILKSRYLNDQLNFLVDYCL
jgi:hypothetical protein